MKIAAAAYPIDWHNRWNEYVGKLRVWVRTGAEQGAELLVFPEHGGLELASLAGEDNARDLRRAIDAVSARVKDVDELHASLAREFKVHVLAASGPIRREDGRAVNRARLFAPDGSHGHQDKVMLSRFEREDWGLEPGDRLRVFETALGRIGILVGYDAEFPLLARTLAEAGADAILVPSCTENPRGYWRVRTGAAARALESQCVVVHTVTVGEASWMPPAARTTGAAAIYGPPDVGFPEDGVISVGKTDAAGWVYADVPAEGIRKVRTEGSVLTLLDWPRQAAAAGPAELVPLGVG
ncbi:MAG TPA: carbon-nitrogen hydrolase family protein [Amaricoccus sp.]|nr:carbon-nitrogen hydrolase family protein [Amaricoccus sp.]